MKFKIGDYVSSRSYNVEWAKVVGISDWGSYTLHLKDGRGWVVRGRYLDLVTVEALDGI
jgi:hypothetical protein